MLLLIYYAYVLIALVWLVVNLVHLFRKDSRGAIRLLLPPVLFFVSLFGATLPFSYVLHRLSGDPSAIMPNWASQTFPLFYFLLIAPLIGLALYHFSKPARATHTP